MGLPNKDTILQKLVVMVKAARKVMGRDDEEGTPVFGHLILLMRDVKGKAAAIEALVLDDEETGGLTNDAKERNTIRQGLKEAFKSIVVCTMHRPHPRIGGEYVELSLWCSLYHIQGSRPAPWSLHAGTLMNMTTL